MHPIDIPMRVADLWLRGAQIGVRAALLPIHVSARVASAVLDRSPDAPDTPEPTAAPAAPQRRTPAKAKPPSRRAVRPDPAPGHAEIHVAEPWEGYAALSAAEVVDRLADADETVRAAVRLYEQANESREAVLHVTEG